MLRGQSHRNATRKANVYASQALRELNVMIAYQALREINAKNVLKIILDIQIVKVHFPVETLTMTLISNKLHFLCSL